MYFNLYSVFFILLHKNADPHIASLIGRILRIVFLFCIISGIRIIQSIEKTCIKYLLKLLFILISQIVSVDQLFKICQL